MIKFPSASAIKSFLKKAVFLLLSVCGAVVFIVIAYQNYTSNLNLPVGTPTVVLTSLAVFSIIWLLLFFLCYERVRAVIGDYLLKKFIPLHSRVVVLLIVVCALGWPGLFLDSTYFHDLRAREIAEKSAYRDRIRDALEEFKGEKQWDPRRANYVEKLAVLDGEIAMLKINQEQQNPPPSTQQDQKDKKGPVIPHDTLLYFVMRSLCLGALGALVVFIPMETFTREDSLFARPNYWQLLIAHIFLGSIVSVVVLGLFYTRQISIYTDLGDSGPEYWRVTIFCILSGAFSERIYLFGVTQFKRYTDMFSQASKLTKLPSNQTRSRGGP